MTTLAEIRRKAERGEPITMVNAYDSTMAGLVDDSDVDMILVGDSLGITMLGYDGTDRVTLDEMIHHAAAVARAVDDTYVVFDLPFGSFNVSPEDAVRNANRVKKETDVDAVKVEGGGEVARAVEAITRAGIVVFGHLGVTPQTADVYDQDAEQFDDDAFLGQTAEQARVILDDVRAMDEAGAAGIILFRVTREVAEMATDAVDGLTIGLGSGAGCDVQMLTLHDLLGLRDLNPGLTGGMRGDFDERIIDRLNTFQAAVGGGDFPTPDTGASMPVDETDRL